VIAIFYPKAVKLYYHMDFHREVLSPEQNAATAEKSVEIVT